MSLSFDSYSINQKIGSIYFTDCYNSFKKMHVCLEALESTDEMKEVDLFRQAEYLNRFSIASYYACQVTFISQFINFNTKRFKIKS
jgi:hypothetical protein